MANEFVQYHGTGRRKSSVARVYLRPGTGRVLVNKREIDDYFPRKILIMDLMQPMAITETGKDFDILVNVSGGGTTGQAGALRLGLARALTEYDENLRGEMRTAGFLTRDARAVERKKIGLHKARKATQYSKR